MNGKYKGNESKFRTKFLKFLIGGKVHCKVCI